MTWHEAKLFFVNGPIVLHEKPVSVFLYAKEKQTRVWQSFRRHMQKGFDTQMKKVFNAGMYKGFITRIQKGLNTGMYKGTYTGMQRDLNTGIYRPSREWAEATSPSRIWTHPLQDGPINPSSQSDYPFQFHILFLSYPCHILSIIIRIVIRKSSDNMQLFSR